MRRLLLAATTLLAFVTTSARPAFAQGGRAFTLFLDCSDFYCEPDYYRTEIAFVDHVRERSAADVHVLITAQSTGGGGRNFTFAFIGQRQFAGVGDTLTATTPQGATEDEQRKVIARTVKLGLARYIARTPEAKRASIAMAAAEESGATRTPARDPWNAWIFRIGANLNGNRERDYSSDYINGNVSAQRTTERRKTNFRVFENYNGQSFTVDSEKVATVRRDYGTALQHVESLNDQWSAGLKASVRSSTYLNQHIATTVAPTLEYDVYPYKEYTRRALLLQYSVGVKQFTYDDTTVYYKTKETRPYQSLTVALSQKQPWGSLSLQVNGYHYLDDISKSRLTFYPEADVRLFKGLSLSLFADYEVLHDQIYLPKGGSTREEVLLRQSQLATSYSAFFYVSISYTFGSVFNNVVNPRFSNNFSDF